MCSLKFNKVDFIQNYLILKSFILFEEIYVHIKNHGASGIVALRVLFIVDVQEVGGQVI